MATTVPEKRVDRPLRDRREDILPLARHFASEFAGGPVRLSPQAMNCLLAHTWSGNVRELRNAIQRACLLCRGDVIEVEHLVQALKAAGKDFEYQIYDLPGGHSFDRLDVPEAWEVRRVIYDYLARHLNPPRKDVELGLRANGRASP